ncbi:hypothetical protein [Desulfosporosinus fructosivorans]|uniref:hypothetical protein n=1 Tax=Desulfosporosinus fructosivorans TaxID=2018669 RepID=UPI001FB16A4B|nr:hypothetical protein [Desulfosporosinus fructosivorans]
MNKAHFDTWLKKCKKLYPLTCDVRTSNCHSLFRSVGSHITQAFLPEYRAAGGGGGAVWYTTSNLKASLLPPSLPHPFLRLDKPFEFRLVRIVYDFTCPKVIICGPLF